MSAGRLAVWGVRHCRRAGQDGVAHVFPRADVHDRLEPIGLGRGHHGVESRAIDCRHGPAEIGSMVVHDLDHVRFLCSQLVHLALRVVGRIDDSCRHTVLRAMALGSRETWASREDVRTRGGGRGATRAGGENGVFRAEQIEVPRYAGVEHRSRNALWSHHLKTAGRHEVANRVGVHVGQCWHHPAAARVDDRSSVIRRFGGREARESAVADQHVPCGFRAGADIQHARVGDVQILRRHSLADSDHCDQHHQAPSCRRLKSLAQQGTPPVARKATLHGSVYR